MAHETRPFTSELLRGASTIALLGATSLVFGFAKDVLVAAVYGAQSSTDSYFAAVAAPRLLESVTLVLLAVVAVSVFVDVRERRGQAAAWRYAENLLGFAVVGALVISAIAAMFALPLIRVLATGFDDRAAERAAALLVLLSPTAGLAGLAAVLAALLNANRVFALPAALGIVVNTAIVAFILTSGPTAEASALAFGTDVGYAVFVGAELAVAVRLGLRPRMTIGLMDRDVQRTLLLALPLTFGAVAEQLAAASERAFASLGDVGTLSTYIFANKIRNVPGTLIGAAIGTVLYPVLSARAALSDLEGFRSAALRASRFALLAATPVALTLVVLATPVTKTVYERGAFGPSDTSAAAAVLAALGAGVVAKSLVEVLARVFYARQQTQLPALATVLALGAQVSISALLVPQWGAVGVGIAVSIATTLQALFLALRLRDALGLDRGFAIGAIRMSTGAAAYASIAVVGWTLIDALFRPATTSALILSLVALGIVASSAYVAVLAALGQQDVRGVIAAIWRRTQARSSVQIERSASPRG
jgi:putative peptidoglycan lipid II flippase